MSEQIHMRPKLSRLISVSLVLACGASPKVPTNEPSDEAARDPRAEAPAPSALRAPTSAAETPWEPWLTGPSSEIRGGGVLPEMMVASVRAQRSNFTSCMRGQHGSAKFELIVGADGTVLRVHALESSIAEAPMKCLLAAWYRTVFPPPIGNARAHAVIPLVFTGN